MKCGKTDRFLFRVYLIETKIDNTLKKKQMQTVGKKMDQKLLKLIKRKCLYKST